MILTFVSSSVSEAKAEEKYREQIYRDLPFHKYFSILFFSVVEESLEETCDCETIRFSIRYSLTTLASHRKHSSPAP